PYVCSFTCPVTYASYTLSLHDALPISPVRANLEQNGAVAVGFSPPTIARAVQVKGVAGAVGEPEEDDLERVERHVRSFVAEAERDRKSTRLNSSHEWISYAVFCLKKKR